MSYLFIYLGIGLLLGLIQVLAYDIKEKDNKNALFFGWLSFWPIMIIAAIRCGMKSIEEFMEP